MAALWNSSGHYIFALWFLSSSFFFFLAYSQRSEIGCLPYFYTLCGLSANLECRSEMCCTRLAGNTGRKNDAKITICAPSRHTNLSGCIIANKACVDNRKKNLLNSNISSTRLHNAANFGPITAEIGSGVWDTHQISIGFTCWPRYRGDVAHRRPNKLCTMFSGLLGWYTMYTFSGALVP